MGRQTAKVVAAVLLVAAGAFHIARAQSVSGTVTDADGTTPLSGIEVTVYTPDETGTYWDYASSTFTGEDGVYTLPVSGGGGAYAFSGHLDSPGITQESYRPLDSQGLTCRVSFSDPTHVYAREVYNNVAHLGQGTIIAVGDEENVVGIDASLELAATISGTVTESDGSAPLSGIWVTAYLWDSEWVAVSYASTDATGAYTIQSLFPGTYRIEFIDYNGIYASEVYDDKANLDLGTNLVVTAGSTTTNINASLAPGATIKGTITQSDGITPIHGIAAEAYQKEGGVWRFKGTGTSRSGNYEITGLAAGTYRVVFTDWNLYYVGEVYDNATDIEAGTDIVVTGGATVEAINASLDTMPTLAGRVTGSDESTPVSGILVTPYRLEAGVWVEQHWCTGISGADGTFLLQRLNPGTFRIGFHDYDGDYLDGFWANAETLETATDIVVVGGAAITGITNALFRASYITGTAYGPEYDGVPDVLVSVYVWNVSSSRWDQVAYDFTDADGYYKISGLRAGTYRVLFEDWNNTYADYVYDGKATLDSGTDVVVDADSTVTDIDAWMLPFPPLTPPLIVGLVRNGTGGFDVQFTADVGSVYMLQETTDLTAVSDDWESFGEPITCQAGTNSLSYTATESAGFVRIIWVP